jgi:hypothetical protein
MVDKKYYKMSIKSIQFSSFLKNFSFEHKCGKLISESPLLPSPLEGGMGGGYKDLLRLY